MKKLIILTIFVVLSACNYAYAQSTDCPPMPEGKLCVSRAVGEKALVDADMVVALRKENAALEQALKDERANSGTIKIEFARMSGENTALKQNAVSDRVIMEILLKSTKKKCMPFSICF